MHGIFGTENRLRLMVDVEAALARAAAAAGVIPTDAAASITEACRGLELDAEQVFAAGWEAGSPVIPVVEALRAGTGTRNARYVHFGATTQDVVDTVLMLQVKTAAGLLEAGATLIGDRCADLAQEHRSSLMLGRTLLQPAGPITFGTKAAVWLDATTRDLGRIRTMGATAALQLGGPVGTLAAFGDRGFEVADRLGTELGLEVPAVPWHTTRDRILAAMGVLAMVAGTMGKIGTDLVLLAQAEVGEVSMRAGKSSSLPHKRNPIDAIRGIAASAAATGSVATALGMGAHELERAAGSWHTEWIVIPEAFERVAASVEAVGRALESVQVHATRMRANLEQAGLPDMDVGLSEELVDRSVAAWADAT